MPTILLTRPAAQSEKLAAELGSLGYTCLIEPLLTINSLSTQPPTDLRNIEAIMLTSSNALEALRDHHRKLEPLLDKPCFCVGARTAQTAHEFGFKTIVISDGDGIALANRITKTMPHGHILHIAARDVASSGRDALLAAGFHLSLWETYAAEASKQLSTTTQEHIKNGDIDAILLYSSRTAQTLKNLLKQHSITPSCSGITIISLSEQIARDIAECGWKNNVTASAPNEDAMIECLKQNCPADMRNTTHPNEAHTMTDTASSLPPASPSSCEHKSCAKKHCALYAIVFVLFFVAILAPSCPWFNSLYSSNTVVSLGDASEKFSALETRIHALDTKIEEITSRIDSIASVPIAANPVATNDIPNDTLKNMRQDLSTLADTIKTLEDSLKSTTAKTTEAHHAGQESAATSLGFIQLREAVLTGKPYTDELATFRKLTHDNTTLNALIEKLAPMATDGIASLSILESEFIALEATAHQAAVTAAAQSWGDKLIAWLQGIVSVRSLRDKAGNGALLASIEADIVHGNLAHALDTLKTLPQETIEALKPWTEKATSRAEVENTLRNMSQNLIENATQATPQASSVAP